MINSSLISIIIPTYNRADKIRVAIDSVKNQTYQSWECLIIDDGSVDETENLINKVYANDERISYLRRDRAPKGAPTCRNIGLSKANGDYIIFLDSDDYLLPHCLEQRINKVLEFPNNDFLVFPMGELIGGTITSKIIQKTDNYLTPFLSANLPWQTMCPFWSKKFLISIKGFKEGYPRFNDPELMIRALIKSCFKFKIFNDVHYDTVHIPSKDYSINFKNKVYQSLNLFIPDITDFLEKNNKNESKTLLSNYLHLWFKYIFIPSKSRGIKQSFLLILLFYRKEVITIAKAFSLIIRLFVYVTSGFILKKPIEKLSSKALYQ